MTSLRDFLTTMAIAVTMVSTTMAAGTEIITETPGSELAEGPVIRMIKKCALHFHGQISGFRAEVMKDKINVRWLIHGKSTVTHFEIERSFDGENFEQVGIVNIDENSKINSAYKFTEDTPDQVRVDYRLKVVDEDGTSYMTDAISVYPKDITEKDVIVNAWFVDRINMVFANENHPDRIRIIGRNGAVYYESTDVQSDALGIYAGTLAAGEYWIEITKNNKRVLKKITKM